MKRSSIIYWLISVAAVMAGGFTLHLQGRGEDEVSTPEPEIPVVWVERLNESIGNELSSLPVLDAAMDSFCISWGLHGASLAIVRNDSLLYARGYGKADKLAPMTPGTTMRLASVSKLLTAIGIMRLQEEGKVFLETPVFGPFGILNEYDGCIRDENYFLMTVEDLLRHRAGFTSRGGDVMFGTLSFMHKYGLSEPPSTDFLVRKELSRRLAYEPGTASEYSNFGYLLLSLVIEKASGMSYDEYMQRAVFEPAGCHGFRLGGDYLGDRLPGESMYFTPPDDVRTVSFDGKWESVERCYGGNYISGLYGAGGWTGSVVELARLVSSIDGGGTVPDILDGRSVEQMTVYFDDETYGLGWLDCTAEGEWTRTGSFAGTSAIIKVYPDGECWIFVTNTSTWRGSRFTRNSGRLFGNLRGRLGALLPARDLFRE